MCGIAGMHAFNGAPVDLPGLKARCDVITHRGPDEEGFYIDHHVALGSRRLRIEAASCRAVPKMATTAVWQAVENIESHRR